MTEWWKKTIAYELYPRSFQDTTGSGSGDLNGIIAHLDDLKELGVGALWLTPVCLSPMVDNGYDIADYTSVDPMYGTMEDMERLIAEGKQRGIRIVMDLVFNHTSDQNPWFLESRSSRDNDKADWYIWRDGVDGHEPTNWRSIFGGSAWTWCESRKQYYLHTFAAAQPDLNWANPDVRKALYDAANFWVGKGVGGFRIDAITYIRKPDEFRDGPADAADGSVSVHDMTANTPGILEYLHEFRRNVCEGHDIFTVAEANGVSADELKYWVGKEGAFDMLFEFSHINLEFKGIETWCRPDPWTIADLKRVLRRSQEATKDNGWYPIFLENHDKPRSIDHFTPGAKGTESSKALAVYLLTTRGTPFLFQGEELGYRNMKLADIKDYNDISSHGQYEFALQEGFSKEEALACVHRFSRDNARTPMEWNAMANAGFTTGTPWLPVHPEYVTENAAAQAEDPDSVLSFYRRLAAVRQAHPALQTGDWQELMADHESIMAYERKDENETIRVYINLSPETYAFAEEEGEFLITSGSHKANVLKGYEAIVKKV